MGPREGEQEGSEAVGPYHQLVVVWGEGERVKEGGQEGGREGGRWEGGREGRRERGREGGRKASRGSKQPQYSCCM